MEKKLYVIPPMINETIKLQVGATHQDINITCLSELEAKEYAQLLCDSFIKHWERRTKEKSNPEVFFVRKNPNE